MYHPHRASPPPTQSSSILTFNLDDDNFEPLWAFASQPSQHTKGPSEPVEDDSPVEEVAVVKPKRKIRPKVSQFCEIYNSVKDRLQSGACDNIIYHEAKIEYRTIYHSAFALTECWKILKDYSKWRKVKMPKFFNSKKTSSKKSRTSETTSQGNSDSTHIGVDLNDEAADSEDVEVQEVRPMGRDAAKKKRSSSGARSESSVTGDPSLVDALVSKFTMAARPFFSSRKESSSEYLRIKERELELEDQRRQEQG
ncbi:glutathione S-transferase T3-like protein [Tanacetum coccineum]